LIFRDQLTPGNDITASSEFGIQGEVKINNITVNPGAALAALPSAPTDADNQIANACAEDTSNQFIASGRGGLPVSPSYELAANNNLWRDVRALSDFQLDGVTPPTDERFFPEDNREIVEASAWQANSRGQIELTSTDDGVNLPSTNCTT